jgi:hypothetical protein
MRHAEGEPNDHDHHASQGSRSPPDAGPGQSGTAFHALHNADAYLTGDKFPNTGCTRVSVAQGGVTVEYVRTWLPVDEGPGRVSASVAFRYTVP